jgi:hypothetical protein
MKITRVTCGLFILLLSLIAFAFTTSAPRAHAASGQTIVIKGHGLHVESGFDYKSPDGCIETTVYVDAFQNIVHKQTVSTADAFIGKFNNCTNTTLLYASGGTDNPTFQINKDLLSASLSATIPVTDTVSGNTFSVFVNMTWTSTGGIQHQIITQHYRTQGFTINSHSNADIRDAIASGTVSDGTTNYTPSGTLWFAQIVSARSVDVTITHT